MARTVFNNAKATQLLQTPLEEIDRELAERSLSEFVRQLWRYIEPANDYTHGWHIDAMCEHMDGVFNGQITRLCINIPPRHMKSLLMSVSFPAWCWIKKPQLRFLYASYASTLSIRDNVKCRRLIDSPLYQNRWSDKFKITSDQNTKIRFDNDKGGFRIATSVDGVATGEGGDIIIIDDANNVKDVESDVTRGNTNIWFDEVIQSRFNDPKTGSLISIQQRTHALDLSGHIQKKYGNEYCYLILPAEYEVQQKRKNSLRTFNGWRDPRRKDGELLWPDRFGKKELENLKLALGSYGCTPYESPILMADLSLKPIGEISVGDEIVGFSTKPILDGEDRGSYSRVHLVKAIVKQVFVYPNQPTVKMKLSSGKVIKCTADHKWYKKYRKDYGGLWYGPAKVGTKLCRVCPPKLSELTQEESRMAGWVAGFFDGDGSVSNCKKSRVGYRPSNQICFYQGAGRNKPLCDKLEHHLSHFKFNFTYGTDDRKDPKKGVNYEYRQYRLTGGGLKTYQKFLHVIRPTKWRKRLIAGAFGTKWIQQRETVVGITPNGNETVYALETTTGNYVVWGLASSNSAGQLQQRPAPREGGLIPMNHFRRYKEPPARETIKKLTLSIDTANKEQEIHDYQCVETWAETLMGYYLLNVWRKKCHFPELLRLIKSQIMLWNPNEVLIEDKQSGTSLIQCLRDPRDGVKCPIIAINPGNFSKEIRMENESAAIEAGLVWLPDSATWLIDFEDECSQFPNAENDEQVDCMSQYLKRQREIRHRGPTLVIPDYNDFSLEQSPWSL